MKPGPFEDVKYVDNKTKYKVTSIQESGKKTEGRDLGLTKVLDPKGKLIWSAPFFVGRHNLNLSPKGEFLILTGNFYFGSELQVSSTETVAEVYQKGKIVKSVTLADLFAEKPENIAQARKLPVKGGGWVDYEDFITGITFDWKAKTISFSLYTKDIKTISF